MTSKPSIQQKIGELLKVFAFTLVLFLLVDVCFGAWVIALVRPSEPFRVRHPVYHHTLKPNYDGLGRWGTWSYRICTNGEGFKTSCEQKHSTKKEFDVAFIGDSFTEGIGLPYEQTFVGMVAAKSPDLSIANLGVVSYSPAIYLAKLKDLFAKGYRFKHIIVFIDIGDAYDEANAYDLHRESIVVDKGEPYPMSLDRKIRRLASQYLPLTGEAWVQLRKLRVSTTEPNGQTAPQPLEAQRGNNTPAAPSNATIQSGTSSTQSLLTKDETPTAPVRDTAPQTNQTEPLETPFKNNIYEGIYLKNYPKSEWTYNQQSPYYGSEGVVGTLSKMRKEMQALHALAQAYGAKLSVGVYPWPGQLKYDVVDSLQVNTWREFCETRCEHFYNAFPTFFSLVQEHGQDKVIGDYFFAGDVHFTKEGNEVIARTLLDTGIK
jgi:hypothetical protein